MLIRRILAGAVVVHCLGRLLQRSRVRPRKSGIVKSNWEIQSHVVGFRPIYERVSLSFFK